MLLVAGGEGYNKVELIDLSATTPGPCMILDDYPEGKQGMIGKKIGVDNDNLAMFLIETTSIAENC